MRSAKCTVSRLAQVRDVVQRAARGGADEGVDVRAQLDERVGQVRAHEAVRAGDEHGAPGVDVAEVALERVEVGRSPDRVAHGAASKGIRSVSRASRASEARDTEDARTARRTCAQARPGAPIVDRLAPIASRPFERFVLDVDGVQLGGTNLAPAPLRPRASSSSDASGPSFDLLAEAIPADGRVVEGGAHLGFVTVHEARATGPGGRVFVFEPNGGRAGRLRENLLANGVGDRVEIVPKALGARGGERRFFVRERRRAASTSRPATPIRSRSTSSAQTRSSIKAPVDVVKLDVEGAELAALRGMEGFMTGGRTAARTLPRVQSGAARTCRCVAGRARRLAAGARLPRRVDRRDERPHGADLESRGPSRTSISAVSRFVCEVRRSRPRARRRSWSTCRRSAVHEADRGQLQRRAATRGPQAERAGPKALARRPRLPPQDQVDGEHRPVERRDLRPAKRVAAAHAVLREHVAAAESLQPARRGRRRAERLPVLVHCPRTAARGRTANRRRRKRSARSTSSQYAKSVSSKPPSSRNAGRR